MMDEERFYTRVPRWFLVADLALCAGSMGIFSWLAYAHHPADPLLRSLMIAAAAASAAGCALAIFYLRNRSRPVVMVSGNAIEFGSIFQVARTRRRIAIDQIAEVGKPGLAALPLWTRSGRRVRVGLLELHCGERQALRKAILDRVERVAAHSAP